MRLSIRPPLQKGLPAASANTWCAAHFAGLRATAVTFNFSSAGL